MSLHPGDGGATMPATAPVEDAPPRREVLLVDAPQTRVRRPGDLLALVASLLGIGFVLVLAVYAHATTQGVTEDVQSAVANVLRQVLLIPVTVLEGLVSFFVPLVVLVDRVVRRSWRSALEALATGAAAVLLAVGALWLLDTVAPASLTRGLTITSEGDTVIGLNVYAAGIAGVLTAVGDRSHSRMLKWSWNLLWIVLALSVVQGDQTLPGALVAVLLGRVAGLGMRYASGVAHERATGVHLVRGLRRAGLDPAKVVRMDPVLTGTHAQAWTVTTSSPIGYTERLREPSGITADDDAARHRHRPAPPEPTTPADLLAAVDQEGATGDTIIPDPLTDPGQVLQEVSSSAVLTLDVESAHRLYAIWDTEGRRHDVTVLDGDRHVVGVLASLWESVRLRGIDRRPATTLREAANRAALMAFATRAAGVRTPELVGITESRDSVLIVHEHIHARRLDELSPDELDDELLEQIWAQLRAAHAKGLAHRDLSAEAVLVDGTGQVRIISWENGEIVSSELSRRIDLAQLLAMLAVLVGTERALASAARVLTRDQLASMAPLLQPVAMPATTRAAASNLKDLLATLREELVELIPRADVAPLQLNRFSVRTVVTLTVAVVAVWALLSWLNIEEVTAAVAAANPVWILVAFGMGLLTYVGSAMGLAAFAPKRLGLWRTTLVQVAASVVSLVAPAGIGPAALNLRFLNKARISTPLAVATVGLVQLSQFITTVLLLVAVALLTGSAGTLSAPSGSVILAVAMVLVTIGVVLIVPAVRAWVWEKVAPTLQQVWPRVVWVVSNPRRLVMGIAGNLIMTAGYVAAFGASLAAFGHTLPLTNLAITYLASNSIGAVVPSPGGIGPVEAALTAGLTLAGIPAATAVSVAILFRVLTFWGRVPLGWAALRFLQHRDAL
ncbi:flippase-like domain-containing protein [Georgenia sp. EYE_87]|uniref:lysylphosphatidylglycerol synthase transmembrane domain-containing protein n=1 Tax=Georgenia sp. EYE_87 TaxID=2853448 RepID=UPI0020060AC5|nr:lysylphosphatidylglycerol synthase transmembrane domain-containing protein [Georgenia sp. EYE_87]MCK6211235.1 flippase-like domain-containing protein [Georgenia sp. EYE_87]